jgi:predicted DCC family thiol-disulfide oxidoreductase YuxK
MSQPIILFDGVCNLCNASVNFIIARDKKLRFKFAALQSEAGKTLLERYDLGDNYLNTMILIEEDTVSAASMAILRIAKLLPFPWPLLYVLKIIPPLIRDPVYQFIARNRYRWFGKIAKCRVPTPEIQERFL